MWGRRKSRLLLGAAAAAALATGLAVPSTPGTAVADPGSAPPPGAVLPDGRQLRPEGRITPVGDFPTGGALTPDGLRYWAVDSGHGHDDVQIVNVADGTVEQVLPLPGAYGGIAFAPDGRTAYVSGEPKGSTVPNDSKVAPGGDAVHVFQVDPATGHATEVNPLILPAARGGLGQQRGGDPAAQPGPGSSNVRSWPEGLAVSPDGQTLVVAMNQADEVAVFDLATGTARLVPVGEYPNSVAIAGTSAYVSNEYDGTVSEVDLTSGQVVGTVGVGGPLGDRNAHPEGLIVDTAQHRLWVAVTNRDLIAEVNTDTDTVIGYVNVGRGAGLGTEPTALALSPDGRRLYSADIGEDAVAVINIVPTQPQLAGRIPTAAYPTGVAVTPDNGSLIWLSAEGNGSGPNPGYGVHWADSGSAPYGTYVPDMLLGSVGVLPVPADAQLAADTRAANAEVVPVDATRAPVGTPVEAPNGGPSQQIKYVFYVVRENRTYDQVFGTDPRGNGDPSLELVDDNGVAGPAGGVTPNAHALARQFPLLDNFYADSEVSYDGHMITSSGYATDFVKRSMHANYSGRGRNGGIGQFPETFPPRDFLFDQAARQGVSFRNDGEFGGGVVPVADDGRPTYPAVAAGTDAAWPGRFGCDFTPCVVPTSWNTDSGTMGAGGTDLTGSRFDHFQAQFNQELATGTVPAFNYLTLPNDHTNGTTPGRPTPKALIADNDLGLGQFVQLISHSPIWKQSAIFVVEDDSQDGGDHVDAHRMPAFVISPWVKHGAVVHTHYDQESAIRTMELILGLKPLSLYDALAAPMYDVFATAPDPAPYTAIVPTQNLTELNTASSPDAALSEKMPLSTEDATPQEVLDRILWHSVYGEKSTPPAPGPNASPTEHARAVAAFATARAGRTVTAASADDDN